MGDGAMLAKMTTGEGFIAALDQSGGSTPKALKLYGVGEDEYSGDDEMFDKIHEMRTRIMTAAPFNGERVLGAILFENTMDRDVAGKPTPSYLWEERGVIPFIKVDKGLADADQDVQLMKPMPALGELLTRSRDKGVFGTKMRSVVHEANPAGVAANVAQQFEVGAEIAAHGLVPILEPEVNIKSATKAKAEAMLRDEIVAHLANLAPDDRLMFKLTLPEAADFYADVIAHPNVVRVVALSGGYSREEANRRLAENKGMIASFSRALSEGLTAQQSNAQFEAALDGAIESIYQASIT